MYKYLVFLLYIVLNNTEAVFAKKMELNIEISLLVKRGINPNCFYEIKLNNLDLTIISISEFHNGKEYNIDTIKSYSKINFKAYSKVRKILIRIKNISVINAVTYSNELYNFKLITGNKIVRYTFGYDYEIYKLLRILIPFLNTDTVQCDDFFVMFSRLR